MTVPLSSQLSIQFIFNIFLSYLLEKTMGDSAWEDHSRYELPSQKNTCLICYQSKFTITLTFFMGFTFKILNKNIFTKNLSQVKIP